MDDDTLQALLAPRAHLVHSLQADLVGPFYPDAREERLHLPPSRWYLTGFLAPETGCEIDDPTSNEELDTNTEDEPEETSGTEPQAKQRKRFPASLGMSVLLPPKATASTPAHDSVEVRVRFAEYLREPREPEDNERRAHAWRRLPREPPALQLPLDPATLHKGVMLPDSPGLRLRGKITPAQAPGLPPGTRALSVFLVNERTPITEKGGAVDEAFIFQVSMDLHFAPGFTPRPNRRGEGGDWDESVAALQFRDRVEYAVGHGVAVHVPEGQGDHVQHVGTTWLPSHEVRRVVTHEEPSVVTDMQRLATLADAAEVDAALGALPSLYGAWLAQQAQIKVHSESGRATQRGVLEKAAWAKGRIEAGLARLSKDPVALEAFRLTNQAMASSALKRSPERYTDGKTPAWRMFQLAFVLLNLEGSCDETHPDRETVDLIFFPTGGGKTEAYLGVIAFTLLMRRLRGRERPDGGLGVAVLLRYTLRLLTLDQLGRAATLVCALELLRREAPERLGEQRFAVGLWVGRSATANTLEQLKRDVLSYKNSTSRSAASPFPLAQCPWCQKELGKESLALLPSATKTERIAVGCSDFKCDFTLRRGDGLPVLFVDEQIYRELPAFIVATVDKFAMLPWRGETGKLFGRVQAQEGVSFLGPMDRVPQSATPLPDGLRPPELIVQDELHLISGPLGTMVGLYETAIDLLCSYPNAEGKTVRPKVIASTATVRRARDQIQALFGRENTELFPPPGVDDGETFFAKVDRKSPGRLYVGVAAAGRSLKGLLLRTYVNALTSGAHVFEAAKRQPAGSKARETADAYMTLAGYFNSLRELGGMRRLVEDEVHRLAPLAEKRLPLDHQGPHPWVRARKTALEPVELTSRESTAKIKESKDRLDLTHEEKDSVDVLLASNMISVGVDIDRLGLMVVAGQPKTTAEYIQASSRVGRQHPGLVLTCFNVTKPRDRSHYEHFAAYHESFYRFVESTSLTPFSGPALSRGLAGTVVTMARLLDPTFTPSSGAMQAEEMRERLGKPIVDALVARVKAQPGSEGAAAQQRRAEQVRQRVEKLLDSWVKIVRDAQGEGQRRYSQFDRDGAQGRALLSLPTDPQEDRSDDEKRFVAPTSMRDVEESVHLWMERRVLGGKS